MNFDRIKDFIGHLGTHDLPTGVAVLVAIILLILVFKAGKTANRFLLFLIAAALLAGAWWWHQNQ